MQIFFRSNMWRIKFWRPMYSWNSSVLQLCIRLGYKRGEITILGYNFYSNLIPLAHFDCSRDSYMCSLTVWSFVTIRESLLSNNSNVWYDSIPSYLQSFLNANECSFILNVVLLDDDIFLVFWSLHATEWYPISRRFDPDILVFFFSWKAHWTSSLFSEPWILIPFRPFKNILFFKNFFDTIKSCAI